MYSHNTLINLKTFISIVKLTTSQLETRYLPDFELQLSRDLQLLREHLQAERMDPARKLAHSCVGLCEVMGAEALSKEIRRIEAGCDTQSAMSLHALTDGLNVILQDTCGQMRTILEHMPREPSGPARADG